jgi:hypothetical protein
MAPPKIISTMTATTLHDVLYTIYIVLCIFYYLDVLITKYGATVADWWARPKPAPLPRIDPHMDERQVLSRTPDFEPAAKAARRSTRRSSNQ